MIRISKSKYLEINLEIDIHDIAMFRTKLMSLLHNSISFEISCIYDEGIFKGESKFVEGGAIIGISDNERISQQDNKLVFHLDYDSIEFLISLLDRASRHEEYMPEICNIPVRGKKKEMTLILVII